jgi:uncharacterized membrane protein
MGLMSRSRTGYVLAAVLLLCAWVCVFVFAPEGSIWDALSFAGFLMLGLVLIPALFDPLDESLKRWKRD